MTAVAVGLAALGWIAARAPRAAGVVILLLVILRAVVAWRVELLPTTLFGLGAGALLLDLRRRGQAI